MIMPSCYIVRPQYLSPETAIPFAGEEVKSNMSADPRQLVEEAIKLEFNMAELYISFHNRFPEDASFWWDLAIEEKNHASLLVDNKQCLLDSGLFQSENADELLAALANTNNAMTGTLRRELQSPPLERILAFNLALRLEESAWENHFQHAMQITEHTSDALKLLQSLNKDDKDHANRIREYMRQNGMA
jgi:hypothetical protein